MKQKLNGTWQGRCLNGGAEEFTFKGKVPGCVHTDLQKAGIIPECKRKTAGVGVEIHIPDDRLFGVQQNRKGEGLRGGSGIIRGQRYGDGIPAVGENVAPV